MGYFFRRSANFGPFRLNFSKSGIGASVGIKGARLTMTPRVTTYVTAGSHGFYYRETLSPRRGAPVRTPASPVATPVAARPSGEIVTADVSDLVDSSTEQLVHRLNERAQQWNPAMILFGAAVALALWGGVLLGDAELAKTSTPGALILAAIALLSVGIWVHKKNTENRLTRLFYELGGTEAENYNLVRQALTHLAQSQRIWRVAAQAGTSDWKRNAGASSLVRRTNATVVVKSPPRVRANVSTPCLNLGSIRLFFMPDVILCWQGGSFGAVPYRDFSVQNAVTRFIEDEGVPGDATVIDRTWRYVNKSGGPDRRFNNNVQLPVLQYGVLWFSSSKGLNIHLNTSNVQVSLAVANCWRELHNRIGGSQAQPLTIQRSVGIPAGPEAQAIKTLGLSANPSPAEISAAYRHLAQLYHPDKVAGLAPEFQMLADKRMKEINAAYELLKGRGSPGHAA
jgi:hypothetical protein